MEYAIIISIALNLFLLGALIASLYWSKQLNTTLDLYESASKRAADLKEENDSLRAGKEKHVEEV